MADVTVVIPVFNAENEISICLDSLLNQIDVDLELILVNDCSTDNTAQIIETYNKAYNNLRIVQLDHNSGSGVARNEGLKYVSSNYVGFIDSDDWVDLKFYKTLLHAIKQEESDMVVAGIVDEYNNLSSSTPRYNYNDYTTITGKIGLKLLTKSCNLGIFLSPIMNNKLYNTKFLRKYNICCSENISWQDDFFSFFAILHAEKITLVPSVQYHYYQHDSSITHSATTPRTKIDNCFDVLNKIKVEMEKQKVYITYQADYEAYIERCITSLLYMLRREPLSNQNDNLIYLFDKIYQNYSIKNIIKYLDNERIYNFFNL